MIVVKMSLKFIMLPALDRICATTATKYGILAHKYIVEIKDTLRFRPSHLFRQPFFLFRRVMELLLVFRAKPRWMIRQG